MNDWRGNIAGAVKDFVAVAGLAGVAIRTEDLRVEFLEAPHRPPSSLPRGKMAIYGFWGAGTWLKIGMAGPKSQARYVSQHYNPDGAPSTLAKSLTQDELMSGMLGFDRRVPGEWIKAQTNRVNILLPSDQGQRLLALLEAFLHVRLRPRYEKQ